MFQIQGNLTAPVQVSNSDNLSSNKVVESVDWAGVYETVSHPQTSLYHFLDLSQDLQHTNTLRPLFTILIQHLLYDCEWFIGAFHSIFVVIFFNYRNNSEQREDANK